MQQHRQNQLQYSIQRIVVTHNHQNHITKLQYRQHKRKNIQQLKIQIHHLAVKVGGKKSQS